MITPGSTLTYFKQFVQPGAGDSEPYSLVVTVYRNGVLDGTITASVTGTLGAKTISFTVPVTYVHGDRVALKAAVVWNNGDPTFSEEVYTGFVDCSAFLGADGKVLISTDAGTEIAAAVLAAFKADAGYAALVANTNGVYVFTPPAAFPGTGTLVLKDNAGTSTLLTITLTYDAGGNVTDRAVA
jgi:hypothetical protein